LRERPDDIEALARHFLQQAAAEGLPRRQLAIDAVELLSQQPWRGNVRELKNFMFRLALLSREEVIDAATVAPLLEQPNRANDAAAVGELTLDGAISHWLRNSSPPPGQVYDAALAAFERPLFCEVLADTGGNQLRAAQVLGINRNTLRKRLVELAIDPDQFVRRT
jgi:two-component system nitrogen regulation response regulator GlnG